MTTSSFMNRLLAAYRPMYLRGLLMDGQYRLPAAQEEKKPDKGNRVVPLTPAFEPERRRVLVIPAAASTMHTPSSDEPSGGLSGA